MNHARHLIDRRLIWSLLLLLPVALMATPAMADEAPTADAKTPAEDAGSDSGEKEKETAISAKTVREEADALWICLAAFLVFFMQAGFAMVECGFTRAKNACNIMMKNVMDFSIGTLMFWIVGFGLMFGASATGLFGETNFLYDAGEAAALADNVEPTALALNTNWAFLIFQTVFCATAATIVSGAMAERTKFIGYLVYTVAITVIVYPIFGSWAWGSLLDGGGWLEGGEGSFLEGLLGKDAAFHDFAGSTVVHSVGGWAALAGAIVLGARIGKYGKDGKVNAIPGHNLPMAALGVFILWLGWFGFNPGSTTLIEDGNFAYIAVTTNLAAAAGAIGAMCASWIKFKKPDMSFTLNGALAGLVAITAGCDGMRPHLAVVTGLLAGVIVVLSVVMFDKLRIDDPVGAISVHGVCGVWGTLAIGLFKTDAGLLVGGTTQQFLVQIVGVAACFAWAFPVSLIIFLAIKYTIGLRVSEAEEREGLDVTEHGMHAYPPVMIADTFPGMPHPSSAITSTAPAPSPVPRTEGA